MSYTSPNTWSTGDGATGSNNLLMNGYLDNMGTNQNPSNGLSVSSVPYGDYYVYAFVTSDGVLGTYIGISRTASNSPVAFYEDLAVSSGGFFSSASITGTATSLGVSGTLSPSGDIFIGGVAQASSVAVAGVSSDGFTTTVLPHARAGATFQVSSRSGRFQGVMIPMTPSGLRIA